MNNEKYELGGEALREHLVLHPPSTPETAPAAFRFERYRRLEIPWEKLMADPPGALPETGRQSSREDIYQFFVSSWVANESQWYEEGKTTTLDGEFDDFEGKLWGIEAVWVDEEHGQAEASEQFFLYHLPSKKKYVLLNKSGSIVQRKKGSFDAKSFEDVWAEIDAVAAQVAFSTNKERDEQRSYAEYVSREPLLWRDEYARLDAMATFGTKVKEAATKVLDLPAVQERWWASPTTAESDYQKYADLATKTERAKILKQRLASRVAERGYVLHLAEKPLTVKDPSGGADQKIEQGEIYNKSKRVVRWSTTRTVVRTYTRRGRSGRRSTISVPVRLTQHHTAVIDDLQKITFSEDPVETRRSKLVEDGKEVFVFRATDQGYVTDFGERLADVSARCEREPEFRAKCVVVIPEYTSFLSNGSSYLGATFFFQPLPGDRPTRFPVIALKEHLSYGIQWLRSELGQLVQSIYLAPGEERTIEITSSFEEEVSTSSSFRSVNEFTAERSLDLSSEIENEAVQEVNKSKQKSASASAGGSFGPFSASGSVSSSSSESLRTYSRHLTKTARRAVQKINRRMSREISSTNVRKVSVSQSLSRSLEIRNINQGRTLNLLFYQINNVFRGGTFLDEIELTVVGGKELIAGSDIYETKTFRLHDLDDALLEITPDKIPVDVKLDEKDMESLKSYWSAFLDTLLDALYYEYGAPRKDDAAKIQSVGIAEFLPPRSVYERTEEEDHEELVQGDFRKWLSADIKDRFDEVKELLESLVLRPEALEPIEMIVASGGLYTDALLGSQPATEPYSETMRELEADKVRAEARVLDARARALGGAPGRLLIKEIAIQKQDGRARIALTFESAPLSAPGEIVVYYEGMRVPNVDLVFSDPTGRIASFFWPEGVEIPTEYGLKKGLWLHDVTTGDRSFFAGLVAD